MRMPENPDMGHRGILNVSGYPGFSLNPWIITADGVRKSQGPFRPGDLWHFVAIRLNLQIQFKKVPGQGIEVNGSPFRGEFAGSGDRKDLTLSR